MVPPLPRPSKSDHTGVPRHRSWCCGGVAAAVLRYCTHSLCRRHGWMVLLDMVRGCVRGCVEECCSNFLLWRTIAPLNAHFCHVLHSVMFCAYVLPYHSIFLHTHFRKSGKCRLVPTQTATTSLILCRRHGPIWPKLERHGVSNRNVATCRRHFQLCLISDPTRSCQINGSP
jgi:hypothetical protein